MRVRAESGDGTYSMDIDGAAVAKIAIKLRSGTRMMYFMPPYPLGKASYSQFLLLLQRIITDAIEQQKLAID